MKLVLMVAMVAAPLLSLHTPARAQFLATADTFAVLGGAAVTNAGPTVLSGDLGVSPGSTITGFPPGIVTNGGIHAGDMAATRRPMPMSRQRITRCRTKHSLRT